MFTPGTNILVRNPKYISRKNTDYLIILSWNIKDEIIRQEKVFLKREVNSSFLFPNLKF